MEDRPRGARECNSRGSSALLRDGSGTNGSTLEPHILIHGKEKSVDEGSAAKCGAALKWANHADYARTLRRGLATLGLTKACHSYRCREGPGFGVVEAMLKTRYLRGQGNSEDSVLNSRT